MEKLYTTIISTAPEVTYSGGAIESPVCEFSYTDNNLINNANYYKYEIEYSCVARNGNTDVSSDVKFEIVSNGKINVNNDGDINFQVKVASKSEVNITYCALTCKIIFYYFEGITSPSIRTLKERSKIVHMIDNFASFTWAGIDMFKNFGAFIINEKKGSLKFNNGPSFKNEYSKQQFQDGYSNLTGISFETQKITFSIGVYWFSTEDYRVLMNLLHPYKVDFLSFDFEPTYGYECKLTAIKDSTRYIVGQEIRGDGTSNSLKHSRLESGDEGSYYRYYTELNLTFEVVGKQCAKEVLPWKLFGNFSDHQLTFGDSEEVSNWWPSDLECPVEISLNHIKINSDLVSPYETDIAYNTGNHISYSNNIYYVKQYISESSNTNFNDIKDNLNLVNSFNLKGLAYLKNINNQEEIYTYQLFDVSFKNLKFDNSNLTSTDLNLKYSSEQGLLYWQLGDKEQILSLLSIGKEGNRMVSNMTVNRFYWPGRLNNSEIVSDYASYIIIQDMSGLLSFGGVQDRLMTLRRHTNII